MKSARQADIPGTRRSIETIATKFNIYFFLAMAIGSGLVFAIGLFETSAAVFDALPEAAVMTVVGMIGFSLFFPWFLALYFARHLILSIKQLESELAALRSRLDTDGTGGEP